MKDNRCNDHDRPGIYEIRVKGHLNDRWVTYFEELTITLEEGGTTLLRGRVVDQAALYGLLKKVRNLGLPLISVNCIDSVPGNCVDVEQAVES